MKKRTMKINALVMAMLMAVGLSACGSSGSAASETASSETAASEASAASEAEATSEAETPKSDRQLVIGCKDFTEQLILGQIAVQALQNGGLNVADDTINLGGSDKTRSALINGDFDMYWEYTGTAWMMHLQHDDVLTDPETAWEKISEEDAANGIVWLPYAELNNTYVVTMRREQAEELGLTTVSDLAAYLQENPGSLIFSGDHEFTARPDGLPGLEDAYGLNFEEDDIVVMDQGLVYTSLRDGQVDVGICLATDGRLSAYDLTVLKDDKQFFPSYNVCMNVRQDTYDEFPEIAEILEPITAKLTDAEMQVMNARVDIDDDTPQEVAADWLKENGFID